MVRAGVAIVTILCLVMGAVTVLPMEAEGFNGWPEQQLELTQLLDDGRLGLPVLEGAGTVRLASSFKTASGIRYEIPVIEVGGQSYVVVSGYDNGYGIGLVESGTQVTLAEGDVFLIPMRYDQQGNVELLEIKIEETVSIDFAGFELEPRFYRGFELFRLPYLFYGGHSYVVALLEVDGENVIPLVSTTVRDVAQWKNKGLPEPVHHDAAWELEYDDFDVVLGLRAKRSGKWAI